MQTVLEKQDEIVKGLLDQVPTINPFLYATDSYKVSHINFETHGVKEIYSNFTARFGKYLEQMLGEAYDGKYVVFGIQWALLRLHTMAKKGFFDRDKSEVIEEMKRVHTPYIGNDKFDHFEALHDLGYLPIVIKTLDEGSIVPIGLPFLTIRNTLPEFEWLPNYLETVLSTDIWKQLTVATIAKSFKEISTKFALETTGGIDGIEWQNHDLSCRGQSGLESSAINGVAFLLSSCGTDNIPALWAADKFYQSTNEQGLLAGSVSAGEHSVTTLGILTEQERAEVIGENIDLSEAEKRYVKTVLTDKFPTGIVSYVGDSFDYFGFLENILPSLKDEVMSRDGKFVVRGDSGNPVDVICGSFTVEPEFVFETEEDAKRELKDVSSDFFHDNVDSDGYCDEVTYKVLINGKHANVYCGCSVGSERGGWSDNDYYTVEEVYTPEVDYVQLSIEEKGTIEHLWDVFGGTINEQGYKVLDSHIGMIYGDGITVQRSKEILSKLKAKGFASTNIVFGVGSYSLNMISRDHLGMAIKATNAIVEINGVDVDKPIYKDPKTDQTKKSARGLLSIHKDQDGNYTMKDVESRYGESTGELSTVYMNGQFHKLTNVFEIRERMCGAK